jgi:hypothetical protein
MLLSIVRLVAFRIKKAPLQLQGCFWHGTTLVLLIDNVSINAGGENSRPPKCQHQHFDHRLSATPARCNCVLLVPSFSTAQTIHFALNSNQVYRRSQGPF